MYSKEEAQEIKRNFWIAFAQEYPRKWLLHNTKIKGFAFKFYLDNKIAQVALEIDSKDDEKQRIYFEKIVSLKSLLVEEHLPDAIFEERFYLENGKQISRIWVHLDNVSVFKQNTWPKIFSFFNNKMQAFELFFYQYEDYIKDLEINT